MRGKTFGREVSKHQTQLCGLDPVRVLKAGGGKIMIGVWMNVGKREARDAEGP